MKFELNDLTPLLDLLAQPAFCTEDGVVCYCNRPARDRGLKTGVSAASLLGAGAELPAPGGAPRQVQNTCAPIVLIMGRERIH